MVVQRGASANAAAAGKFVWSRATVGNLATTVVTLMTTSNKAMRVHLPVYMINSCSDVSCQHLNHICSVPLGFTKCLPGVDGQ